MKDRSQGATKMPFSQGKFSIKGVRTVQENLQKIRKY